MRKKIFLVVTATMIALAIAVLAGEIYLRRKQRRTIIPEYALAFHTHRGQKISVQEGSLKLSFAPFTIYKNLPSQRTKTFSINSRGLRADENVERDPSPKIVFLGGSAAFGQGARTDQETIQHILEQSLKPYRVLNGGVAGFLSGQELTYLVTELVDYSPRIVVAYDGWNDLFDTVYSQERTNSELGFNSNFFSIEDQLLLNHQTQVSPYRSLGRLVDATSKKSLLLSRLTQRLHASQQPGGVIHKDRLDAVVLTYVTNLRKMALFSHAHGSRFIVIFQPELGQKLHLTLTEQKLLDYGIIGIAKYREEFPVLYRQFLAKAKQLLTRDGIEWLDINESIKYLESRDNLFVDVVHTNHRGNELVAEIIAPPLLALTNSRHKADSEAAGLQK